MKKSIVLLTMLLIILSFGFAKKTAVFEQSSTNLIVDLAATRFTTHTATVTWGDDKAPSTPDKSKYYGDQMLGLVGMYGNDQKTSNDIYLDADVKLTVELTSGKWFYIYQGTDTRYMRPFGIYLHGRGKKTGLYGSGDHYDLTGYNLYLGEDNGSTRSEVILPYSEAKKYVGLWWDLILVFPKNVDTKTDTVKGDGDITYNLLPSNDFYTAIVTITIECGDVKEVFEIPLNGYYKPTSTNFGSTICSLNITKTSGANSVDIANLYNTGAKTTVANYNLTTNTKNSGSTTSPSNLGNFKLVLSSSNNLNNATEEFTLRHVNANGTTSLRDTNYNSIKYRAYLISSNGTEVEFTGTDTLTTALSTSGKKLTINADVFRGQDGKYQYRWHDNGAIAISIPKDASIQKTSDGNAITIDNLMAGQYTSNIYIHVITDNI